MTRRPRRWVLVGNSQTEGVVGPSSYANSWAGLLETVSTGINAFDIVNLGCGGSMALDWSTHDDTKGANPSECNLGNAHRSRYTPSEPTAYVHYWHGENEGVATVGTPPGAQTDVEFDTKVREHLDLILAGNKEMKIVMSYPLLVTFPTGTVDLGTAQNIRIQSYWPKITQIIADYPEVSRGCHPHVDIPWDYDTMTSGDFIHPGDFGHAQLYDCILPTMLRVME